MASVAICDVRKAFGATEVIHGVDVLIGDGEFVVLVGPSGCGKSTLLRMIAGLENITSGEIRIGERVVNRVPPKERDIAMVFQNYALYPHMTVAANMGFSLMLRGAPKGEIAQRVKVAADILGLTPCSTVIRASSPVASASAWPWAAPSCAIRRCFYSTNRCRISTPSSASPCAPRSRNCTSA
jgi:ABC-type sugar transport system ATPase subunit